MKFAWANTYSSLRFLATILLNSQTTKINTHIDTKVLYPHNKVAKIQGDGFERQTRTICSQAAEKISYLPCLHG
jgi:hypothetical protein